MIDKTEVSNVSTYIDKRDSIKTGDLLAWSTTPYGFLNNTLLGIIRFFTMSEFSHVGIAYRKNGRLYVYEATIPRIHLIPVSARESFYHIPTSIKWKFEYENYIHQHIGKSYSILDAIRGYFGKTNESNDVWQCAELCLDFYRKLGIDLGDAYTPSKLVKQALLTFNTSLSYIKVGK